MSRLGSHRAGPGETVGLLRLVEVAGDEDVLEAGRGVVGCWYPGGPGRMPASVEVVDNEDLALEYATKYGLGLYHLDCAVVVTDRRLRWAPIELYRRRRPKLNEMLTGITDIPEAGVGLPRRRAGGLTAPRFEAYREASMGPRAVDWERVEGAQVGKAERVVGPAGAWLGSSVLTIILGDRSEIGCFALPRYNVADDIESRGRIEIRARRGREAVIASLACGAAAAGVATADAIVDRRWRPLNERGIAR